MTADNATSVPSTTPAIRLTSFSHGGGFGCKVAPGVLSQILRGVGLGLIPLERLVGIETADDVAHLLNDEQAPIATTTGLSSPGTAPTGVSNLTSAGCVTGASARNWASYGAEVERAPDLPPLAQPWLAAPQTSGDLLVSCAPAALDEVRRVFHAQGFDQARAGGRMKACSVGLEVTS